MMLMLEGKDHCAVRLRGLGIIISEAGSSNWEKGKPIDVLENGAGCLNSSAKIEWRVPRPLPARPLVFPVTSEPLIPIKILQVEGQAVKRRSN